MLEKKYIYNMNKRSGTVSFRKNILGWLGDRTTATSLLVRALYRCDHQAVQLLGGHIGIIIAPRAMGAVV